jgi:type VI secretion system secreted protein VgrG
MIDQQNRMLRLLSPLGDDACVVMAFSGAEHISDIFQYQVSLQAKSRPIPAGDIVGNEVTLELYRDVATRYFHGIVEAWSDTGISADGTRHYQLIIAPRMALLGYSRHNRIFENLSAVDIVSGLLAGCGEKLDRGSVKQCPRREICTQYNETDLEFVNRLLAEEGIAYFFRHEKSGYRCVLVDAPAGFCNATPAICEFTGAAIAAGEFRNVVTAWQPRVRISSERFTSLDHGEYNPAVPLKAVANSRRDGARFSTGEVQLYGQHYFQRDSNTLRELKSDIAGEQTTRWLAACENDAEDYAGSSNIAGFGAGLRVKVKNAVPDGDAAVLLASVYHTASDGNTRVAQYSNTFTAVSASAGYVPLQKQQRPLLYGTHSAKVVDVKDPASSGALGEVRVKFPWEQTQASCWARVTQLYAGNRWGSYFIPEPGQEVLVEFLNGDPDRPVVVGALYNRNNLLPPYTRTQSGIRTRSKKYNELRFDDSENNEEVFFKAGRDHNYVIGNDENGTIANSRSVTISNGDDNTVISSGSQTIDVARNITITANQSITLQVGSSIVRIEPAGITLQGTMITLLGSAQVEIKGGALTDIDGGIVRINS